MKLAFNSKSSLETQKISSILAEEIVKSSIRGAFVLALEGDLGSGKTTFTQGFARSLGIKENVLSPTFVLMKVYSISQTPKAERQKPNSQMSNVKGQMFRHLIHIDCYRMKSPRELAHLGFKNLLKDKDAIILIEWADRIRKLLPKNTVWIRFKHGERINERILQLTIDI